MMHRLLLAVTLGCGLLAAADDAPKPEAILDRYVEVTGGKQAYEKIHSEVTKGTMELTGKGIKGSLVSYQAEPNRDYTVADLEGVGKVESGSDGDVFWERSAISGPRVKSGDERAEIAQASLFNPHLNWRKIYSGVEMGKPATIDGEECDQVVLTPKGGRPVSQFFSRKTGLLLKISSVHATQMGDIPAENFLKDYKPVADVIYPFTRISRFAGQEIAIRVTSVELNPEIPKDRFDLPDEIKALVRKNGASK